VNAFDKEDDVSGEEGEEGERGLEKNAQRRKAEDAPEEGLGPVPATVLCGASVLFLTLARKEPLKRTSLENTSSRRGVE